jgi:hypothetical protein
VLALPRIALKLGGGHSSFLLEYLPFLLFPATEFLADTLFSAYIPINLDVLPYSFSQVCRVEEGGAADAFFSLADYVVLRSKHQVGLHATPLQSSIFRIYLWMRHGIEPASISAPQTFTLHFCTLHLAPCTYGPRVCMFMFLDWCPPHREPT